MSVRVGNAVKNTYHQQASLLTRIKRAHIAEQVSINNLQGLDTEWPKQ